jgi:DNA-binding GntR family transcriptional regulator
VAEAKGLVGVLQAAPSEAPSLAERAYRAIREMIVSLELRPGAVIDERRLMERLGIGRTPTREALRRLAQERLVEVYPRRGMFVTSVEIRDLASLAEVRSVLESHAARRAAERSTADEREALEMLLVELDGRSELDARELMALDERIHRQVWRCASGTSRSIEPRSWSKRCSVIASSWRRSTREIRQAPSGPCAGTCSTSKRPCDES